MSEAKIMPYYGDVTKKTNAELSVMLDEYVCGLPSLKAAKDELVKRLDRWHALYAASSPPPNTVPVRIAVAVNVAGKYEAMGSDDATDDEAARLVKRWFKECRISWITAHVPLPEQPAEIEGSVE